MRDWKAGIKVAEECSELIKEVMKLSAYPEGTHPRKGNLINKVEAECADVLAVVNYFIDRNGLNRERIKRRQAYKHRKHAKRWGAVPKLKTAPAKKGKKRGK